MGSVAVTTRVIASEFAVPNGTAIATPVTLAVNLGQTQLQSARIIIPVGHVGVTGLQIFTGQAQILPWDNRSSWIRGDDDDFTYPLDTQVTSNLTLRGYNLGRLTHTFLIRWTVDDAAFMRRPQSTLIVPV